MKDGIWNVLSILGAVAIIAVVVIVFAIFANPQTSINPLPPPTLPAPLMLPTATPTLLQLPPTWTPKPNSGNLLTTPVPLANQMP